jgi:hypothetical protein
MKQFNFRIAADAAEYLQKHLLRTATGDLLVLTIAPLSSQQKAIRLNSGDPEVSKEELTKAAKEYLTSLSSPVALDWVLGGVHRSRVPQKQLLLIDGIECFFPKEIRSVVNDRVLLLRNGELVFDPDLDPPPRLSLSKPDTKSKR